MSASTQYYVLPEPFRTEQGDSIPVTIAYATYGTLNAQRTNVIWVCHALTANAQVADWWPGMVGTGCAFDPDTHFMVCANILGSCYGTTGPASTDPSGTPYGTHFPRLTIRDLVAAHIRLRQHLGLPSIALLVGGSMGGYQALEWALMEPQVPEKLLLLATAAAESAWGIAIHEAQRMAIEADPTWTDTGANTGRAGLMAARAIGMLTYRNYQSFADAQSEPDPEKTDDFRAAGYQRYQGQKLADRFDAKSYWTLTKAMDTHNVSRGRGRALPDVLAQLPQPTLVIGISSDLLCPMVEQRFLAAHLPAATLVEIDSTYGHDGFLIEVPPITTALRKWWR
ncbi:MAG: homoserine O-acetyltransferase [Sphingobacteriales bacterium]|nr:MAG: homoserine O-acetyltransferase [Sphingobacteriales bacterium]